MPHYHCHLIKAGQRFDEAGGYIADDDREAIDVARAIAHLILRRDPTTKDVKLVLQRDGIEIVSGSLATLASRAH